MGADVADGARAGDLLLEAPGQRPVRIGRPILQVRAAEGQDLSDPTVLDVLPRERDRGRAAIVEGDHVGDARGFSTASSIVLASSPVRASGFSQMMCLPALRRGDRDLGMAVVRGDDVDDVDVLARDDHALPVVRRLRRSRSAGAPSRRVRRSRRRRPCGGEWPAPARRTSASPHRPSAWALPMKPPPIIAMLRVLVMVSSSFSRFRKGTVPSPAAGSLHEPPRALEFWGFGLGRDPVVRSRVR